MVKPRRALKVSREEVGLAGFFLCSGCLLVLAGLGAGAEWIARVYRPNTVHLFSILELFLDKISNFIAAKIVNKIHLGL